MEWYRRQHGVETRWASGENPSAARGAGGTTNRGAKGAAFNAIHSGETLTLLDIPGSGIIRRIWLTLIDRSPQMLRSLKVDMYWDGAEKPAVSAPLGDFFGIGLGRTAPFWNQLFSNPEGRSFNCAIPMPYRHGARITLSNESNTDLSHLFYDIDLQCTPQHDNDTLYFHTHWRQETPNALGADFTVLPTVHGVGRYLGANFSLLEDPCYAATWWGEGELKIWLDGDGTFPTLCGTGSEDAIGTGWGQGEFSHPTQGSIIADIKRRQWCFYRCHTHDPITFNSDCRVALQTIGGGDKMEVHNLRNTGVQLIPVSIYDQGKLYNLLELPQPVDLTAPELPAQGWTNFYRQDSWSATAYFYLNAAENDLPELPPAASRIAGLATDITGNERRDG